MQNSCSILEELCNWTGLQVVASGDKDTSNTREESVKKDKKDNHFPLEVVLLLPLHCTEAGESIINHLGFLNGQTQINRA